MKKSILSAAVVLLAAAAAHAQVIVVDTPRERQLIGHGPRCGYYGWGGYGVGGYGFGGYSTAFSGYGCPTGEGPLI